MSSGESCCRCLFSGAEPVISPRRGDDTAEAEFGTGISLLERLSLCGKHGATTDETCLSCTFQSQISADFASATPEPFPVPREREREREGLHAFVSQ